MSARPALGAVIIGRNEGARLEACLASLAGQVSPLVYVDSGSTDGSIEKARAAGAQVVALDVSTPFTAARARWAGFEALEAAPGGAPDFVQFVDGDCAVEPGWLAAGTAALAEDETLGLVTGWRREAAPDASIYNALCAVEWHRPAGPIRTCGGDMMVRSTAYREAGGWRGDVIAAEDDELCLRIGKAGWKLVRIPEAMTLHDAEMTRFGQWWRRAVRTGHGFAQVGHLHPDFFVAERRRAWLFALLLPLFALSSLWLGWGPVALAAAAYLLSYARTARGLVKREGLAPRAALHQAVFLTLSKFPNLIGMLTYYARRARGAKMRIIEYK